MKAYELIEKLMQHDLNRDVMMPDVFEDENIGIVIDYEDPTDVTGVELTKTGKLLLLD